MKGIAKNALTQEASGVWVLNGHSAFGYTDGAASDAYLRQAFESASDLGIRSEELRSQIRDWPSEYHLTPKRSQLLSGFEFDRNQRVLEVGCGCGAITRFLGETFCTVVSVEGDINRARLTRIRARDLPSVSVLCAPFQAIDFTEKFDVIFCIGVFEYSGLFVESRNPYGAIVDYFSTILADDGILIMAIENQLGLKYFCGADEDHTGRKFDGIEGYRRAPQGVRTFGKPELTSMLRKQFGSVDFYYPYPDYKVPDIILSQSFLESGLAGEIVSQSRSRNYSQPYSPMWQESAAVFELERNKLLDLFSNSFLIVAGKDQSDRVRFPQEGIFYSANRRLSYSTQTRILKSPHGGFQAVKARISPLPSDADSPILLNPTTSDWKHSLSLQTTMQLDSRRTSASLAEILQSAEPWIARLKAEANDESSYLELGGHHIDSIWGNAYIVDGRCELVDREWVWREALPLNVVVIRAIYDFLHKDADGHLRGKLSSARSGRLQITEVAKLLGIELKRVDFDRFVGIETQLESEVFGLDAKRVRLHLRWYLADFPSLDFARDVAEFGRNLLVRLKRRIRMLSGAGV